MDRRALFYNPVLEGHAVTLRALGLSRSASGRADLSAISKPDEQASPHEEMLQTWKSLREELLQDCTWRSQGIQEHGVEVTPNAFVVKMLRHFFYFFHYIFYYFSP